MKKTIDEAQMTSEEIYLSRLGGFQRYYLQLVIFAAVAVGVGIVIAVISNVLLGAALVILSASVYVYFSTDEARKQLGMGFSNTNGHIVITKLTARYGDCVVVPARFIWADVTRIADGALSSKKNSELARIYLPRSIEHIGKDVLGDNSQTLTVLYEGTPEEWNAIDSFTDFSACEILFECRQPTLSKKQKKVKDRKGSDGEAAE